MRFSNPDEVIDVETKLSQALVTKVVIILKYYYNFHNEVSRLCYITC